jgi:protein involved in ribonucleotide reduction
MDDKSRAPKKIQEKFILLCDCESGGKELKNKWAYCPQKVSHFLNQGKVKYNIELGRMSYFRIIG